TTLTTTAEVVPPRIIAITLSPDSITCGQSTQCTISLDRASLDGDVVVELFCGDPGYATVPASWPIPQNSTSATFTITTPAFQVAFPTAHIPILAVYRSAAPDPGSSVAATLTIRPLVVAGFVKSLVLNPTTVTDGQSSHGIVTLIEPVPTPTVVGLL